jgi:hypothetical protein
MKTPMGFVMATTRAKKITICAIPSKVISPPQNFSGRSSAYIR